MTCSNRVTWFFPLLLVAIPAIRAVDLSDFYPYGKSNGDIIFPAEDDTWVSIDLPGKGVDFGGNVYTTLYLSSNGFFTFTEGFSQFAPKCKNVSFPFVAPFLSDNDLTIEGHLYYRVATDVQTLLKGAVDIKNSFPSLQSVDPIWAFIATWDEVTFYGAGTCSNPKNTFQVALLTDGHTSFVFFIYGILEWSTSVAYGGDKCKGNGGAPALAGIHLAGQNSPHFLTGSCGDDILNTLVNTNVDFSGKWGYRVDTELYEAGCKGLLPDDITINVDQDTVNQFGFSLINITALCINFTEQFIGARLYTPEPENISCIIERTYLSCLLPQIHKNGEVKLEVDLLSDANNTKDAVYTRSATLYTKVSDEVNVTVLPNGNVNIRWYPENFEGWQCDSDIIEDIPLEIGVMGYAGGEFKLAGLISSTTNNSGSYTGAPETTNVLMNLKAAPFYIFVKTKHDCPSVHAKYLLSMVRITALRAPFIPESEYINICSSWAIGDVGPPSDLGVPCCPPLQSLASSDKRFVRSDLLPHPQDLFMYPGNISGFAAYRQSIPTNDSRGQFCVYQNGNLWNLPPSAGPVEMISPISERPYMDHYMSNVWPWLICCGLSGGGVNSPYCNSYYDKRPTNDGSCYQPPDLGDGGGDPHVRTFDNVAYTMGLMGEFWLIKGPINTTFSSQIRIGDGCYPATGIPCVKAIVMVEDHVHIQVTYSQLHKILLYINGKPIEQTADKNVLNLNDTATVTLYSINEKKVDVSFRSGFSFTIQNTVPSRFYLDYTASSQFINRFSGYRGIMGQYDGIRENDFTTPDNVTVPISASLADITNIFVNSWRIKPEESLFDYPAGSSPEDYLYPDYQPIVEYPDPSTLPQEIIDICQENIECMLDYVGSGGNLDQAKLTKQQQEEMDELIDAIHRELPMCPSLASPENGYVAVEGLFPNSSASYFCMEDYILEGSEIRRCELDENSSTYQWTDEEPVCIATCKVVCKSGNDLLPDPNSCSHYYVCIDGEPYHYNCPAGLVYNPILMVCDWPDNYHCVDPPGC